MCVCVCRQKRHSDYSREKVQFYQHQLELFHNLCYVRSVTILPTFNRATVATPVCGDI